MRRLSRFFVILILLCLFSGSAIWSANLAFAQTVSGQISADLWQTSPALQSSQPITISFEAVGYGTRQLVGPSDTEIFAFRFPETWELSPENNRLILDYSFSFEYLDPPENPLEDFGEMFIYVNDILVQELSLEETQFENRQLEIDLPEAIFEDPTETRYTVKIDFGSNSICIVPNIARLSIHESSYLEVSYEEILPVLNLANYPSPFFDWSPQVDNQVFAVLPEDISSQDATNIASVVAKLGHLSSSRLPISTTFDIDITRSSSSSDAPRAHHLLIAGHPGNNRALSLLNRLNNLPVPFYQRQANLTLKGPEVGIAGNNLNYQFAIDNTLEETLNLSLISNLPYYTEFVTCQPDCLYDEDQKTLSWSLEDLEPGAQQDFSLVLESSDAITGEVETDWTLTVIDEDLGPINAASLYTTLTQDISQTASEQDYQPTQFDPFFFYRGQAVARQDGVVQLLRSPWNPGKVILIMTGETDVSVKKASQAMGSELAYPGLNGTVAIIKDVQSSQAETGPEAETLNFSDLGFSDRTLEGYGQRSTEFRFEIPFYWQFNSEPELFLNFNHSQLINLDTSSLSVYFNRLPIASIALNEQTAVQGDLNLPLPVTSFEFDEPNRLRVEARINPKVPCSGDGHRPWLLVRSSSNISFTLSEDRNTSLDLGSYPYPFITEKTLKGLLLILPDQPDKDFWNKSFALIKSLGTASADATLQPQVALATDLQAYDLAEYHILTLGKPSQNSFLAGINEALPQSFIPGRDEIDNRLGDVILRLPADLDLGLLQLIPSPWNDEKQILAVSATNDGGLDQAFDLTIRGARALNNNLMFIADEEILSLNAAELLPAGITAELSRIIPNAGLPAGQALNSNNVLSQSTELTTATASDAVSDLTIPASPRPAWLIPMVIVTILLIILVFVIAFWQSRRNASEAS